MGSIDRPGQPDQPDQPEHRGGGGESEARRAERLGLDKLSRADFYKSQQPEAAAQDAARLGSDRKTPSGAPDRLAHRPEDQPTAKIESAVRTYWTEVPRFLAYRDSLVDRYPPGGRPESTVGATGDAGRRLDPVKGARVDSTARNVAGAEPYVSENIEGARRDCSKDVGLGGFEFRLKGIERIKEKAADKLRAEPDRTPEEVVREIPDAIRYTYCLKTKDYSAGYGEIKQNLEARGFEMYYCKNYWSNPEYKGLNTRWVTPRGQRFEIQFHTRESFHAKHEVTHQAYERLRNPATTENGRRELRSFQREVSSWIPVPNGAREIPDYKKEVF